MRYPVKNDPYSSHAALAREVRRLARERGRKRGGAPLIVLDAGCGPGSLGRLLGGARRPDVVLLGLDAEAPALRAAESAGYAGLILADLEADALPALSAPVDVLVCADVLEHCRRPEEVLSRLMRRYLRPGGAVLVSLPNVALWYVRAQLLAGRWRYADRGILDRTHLRFFTAESGEDLLRGAGVAIERRRATPIPLPVVGDAFGVGRPLFPVYAVSAWLTRFWPTLLAYQIVFAGRWDGEPERAPPGGADACGR
jgi:SAM-dependent methyltransferase